MSLIPNLPGLKMVGSLAIRNSDFEWHLINSNVIITIDLYYCVNIVLFQGALNSIIGALYYFYKLYFWPINSIFFCCFIGL